GDRRRPVGQHVVDRHARRGRPARGDGAPHEGAEEVTRSSEERGGPRLFGDSAEDEGVPRSDAQGEPPIYTLSYRDARAVLDRAQSEPVSKRARSISAQLWADVAAGCSASMRSRSGK